MDLTREEMLNAIMASDARFDGRFFTGVLSTGIYCIPSCRARKPKPENVRFFATREEARREGLRACLKCRPDALESGDRDPLLAPLEAAVRGLREDPSTVPSIPAFAAQLEIGETKLYSALRTHFHTTPATLLADARVAAVARTLRTEDATVAEAAFGAGFETLSAFYDHFRARTGLTPSEYRVLPGSKQFTIALPAGFRSESVLAMVGRDTESQTERATGSEISLGLWLSGVATTLRIGLSDDLATVRLEDGLPAVAAVGAHEVAVRLLGLGQDPLAFESHAVRLGQTAWIDGRRGLRIPQTTTVFDGLVWSIVGQQVGLGFAYALRRRLAEQVSPLLESGLRPLPRPQDVAALDELDLIPLQYSRRKAEYLLGIARAVPELSGQSATRAMSTLLGTRGFGPWAANYVLMRALGFGDCVPLGDTGLLAALRRIYGPEVQPNQVAELLAPFAPFRSLACFHLWQSLKQLS